ncbi:MAG: type III pantothenate kinase [Cyclobacteriaceae bacterium]|jgi:type III pantothenate kinase
MLLTFDIGNSDITIGLWDHSTWRNVWRIPSKLDQPELFFGIRIRDYFTETKLDVSVVESVVLSSVVPNMTEKIRNVIRSLFGMDPLVLGPSVFEKLPIKVLNPYEVGSDLVSNAMGAWHIYRKTCVVCDFGTALTFTTVSEQGEMLGVSIVPGLRTAIRALSQNTAKLFDVPLEIPKSALGTNTITAIQSGLVLGYDGLVRNVVSSIRQELGEEVPAIATGGMSFVISSLKGFFFDINPNLTLEGLRLISEHVKK